MKLFSADRPIFGLFSSSVRGSQMERAMRFSDPSRGQMVYPSTVWDAALARRAPPIRFYRQFGKRALDITLILLSAPFWLPMIAMCALALWLEGGQPFYRQDRLGKRGVSFSILKLRTMVRDADKVLKDMLSRDPEMQAEWDALQKLRDDPRITPVGKVLRATSLDELPQLINVLKGDMSLVGPRPMMPDQLSLYGDPRAYFEVHPGLTGLWQVSARNNNKFTYRHGVDEAYENALSFKLDCVIIYKTFGVVLRQTGC